MEKILFADVFKKNLNKIFHIPKVVIDDPIFRLHYKVTGLTLLFLSITVTAYQFIGDPIKCIQKDDIPEDLLNTYCWIEGTFTLPRALGKKVGVEVVYPGVDKHQTGDRVIEHAYYQWVCFVLFLQAVMFCVPYMLWKALEGGKMRNLILEFRQPIVLSADPEKETHEQKKKRYYKALAGYYRQHASENVRFYALAYFGCEFLNFVNVVGQIFFLDRFLGGYFGNYGTDVVRYANADQETRFDPMIRLFPRLTKCTFHRYGSSGDVQKHDALCLLPLNILNEKIFVMMWFWLIVLAILGGCSLVYRLILFYSKTLRFNLLHYVSTLTSQDNLESFRSWSYGHWFQLYMLADNIDNIHFLGFVKEYRRSLDEKPTIHMTITAEEKEKLLPPEKG